MVWLLCVVGCTPFFFGSFGSGALGAIDSLGPPAAVGVLHLALGLILKLILIPGIYVILCCVSLHLILGIRSDVTLSTFGV